MKAPFLIDHLSMCTEEINGKSLLRKFRNDEVGQL